MEEMRGGCQARARAQSNIAFIKYWGNRDDALRLPANSSLSMNLADLHTTTTVQWLESLEADTLMINGVVAGEGARQRASSHLDLLRDWLGARMFARVESSNNFPMGTGIASSASGFAALTLAAAAAAGQANGERELSAMARRGSGSAARSIPGGFVEWHAGESHLDSYAESIADADHWALVDVIAVVNRQHKRTGSSAGHSVAGSSVLQRARVETADERLRRARNAILERDFEKLAEVVEEDSNLMHAVMMTSRPALFYWEPASLRIMREVERWRRRDGLQVCYTLDAGPNVHCICAKADSARVEERILAIDGVLETLSSPPGPGAFVLRP